ncbi:hypothetical protein [Domibacillus robiginosus]|uniref:hypothetical protein n=1 Tax=Domibacillus robiginosus TaxID=1071054 RepID=UPI00067CB9C9|nr:hypothetical protein [Domibacillus robiginosus]
MTPVLLLNDHQAAAEPDEKEPFDLYTLDVNISKKSVRLNIAERSNGGGVQAINQHAGANRLSGCH